MNTTEKNNTSTAVEKREPTATERFTAEVKRQFQSSLDQRVDLTEHQRQLMKNMFIKIDSALQEHEARRLQKNKGGTPITWKNIDMQKLALDSMHRIRLGLDALIKNHIHAIPYFNSKTKKYDLDLRIGYKGKLYYRKEVAKYPVKNIRLELVHESDEFTQVKKDQSHEKDTYEFKVTKPFERGKVVGGFGYIEYEDDTKNEVVTISREEFDDIKQNAPTNKFWGPWEKRMQMKTLAHRTSEEIEIDPKKVNKSFHYVEAQEDPYQDDMEVKIEQPEQRKSIDVDLGCKEQPEKTSDQNATSDSVSEDFEDLLAEVNKLGKKVHGGIQQWVPASKQMIDDLNEDVDSLDQLSINGLLEIKNILEQQLKSQEAQ